jgi:release factor glutamine methyltransferase
VRRLVTERYDVAGALAWTEARLDKAGVESPRVDAETLLAQVLRTTRSGLQADRRRELGGAEQETLEALVSRRETREPLAYVLGEWGFRRLTLTVDPRVLVPRPETEIVVERALALIERLDQPRVLDVGTGSGAIALAIADEHPGAKVTGMDASAPALEVARANGARTGLPVELVQADLFAGLPAGPWDLVVSNPPYVSPGDIGSLQPEVRDWEPRAAVVGEGATEAIAENARSALRPGGALVLEIADGTAPRVAGLLREAGYSDVETTRDLAGRERVVEGRR